MKIAYVFSSLATIGGTERMIAEKANYLSEKFGYDITIINCIQLPNDVNKFKISERVKQYNLGIPYYSQYKYKYPKRLWVKWKINKILKKAINETVQQIDPDILIGVSRYKANHISTAKCRAKKIIECHEVRFNTLYDPSLNRAFPIRFFMKINEYFYLKKIERNADIIVTLTPQDRRLWKRAKRVEVISNFSTMHVTHYSNCNDKRVVALGRLEWEKGFGRLIEIWSMVSARYPDWHLDIYGEGTMLTTLNTLIKIYRAHNLTIHEFTSNISDVYANSSICVVTSYFEGFSLAILEALKHGVPCVAFDCPFGPGSIIEDARCGFLVDNGDLMLFAERVCWLMKDDDLRKDFSIKAIERAEHFDVVKVMNQWKELFEEPLLGVRNNNTPN